VAFTDIHRTCIAATYCACSGAFTHQLLLFRSKRDAQCAGIVFPFHGALQTTVHIPGEKFMKKETERFSGFLKSKAPQMLNQKIWRKVMNKSSQ
jgi:hypothetical protein